MRTTATIRRTIDVASLLGKGYLELSYAAGDALWKAQKGQEKAGHKYIRRAPDGKGGWRYFYSDASATKEAEEGERLNLGAKGTHDVVKVHDGGHVTLRHSKTGHERTIHVSQLHEELGKAHGERMQRGAERLVKRALAGVDPSVDHSDHGSLMAAYRGKLAALGMPQEHADSLLQFIASRQPWTDDARKVLAHYATSGLANARRTKTVAQGADNLRRAERAKQVEARHVAAAAKAPTGPKLDELRAKVSAEVGKLTAALGAAEALGESTARKAVEQYAKTLVESPAIHDLDVLVKAFPKGAEMPEYQALMELRGKVHAFAGRKEDGGKGIAGAETTIFVADESGNPVPQKARFRLIEAEEAIASHSPASGFRKNAAYPEGVQERAYHEDTTHQQVVRENARKLHPALVANTNPDAVNGPPVMTPDGIVLGGNSRTMAIQLAHEDGGDARSRYIKHLKDNATTFGLTADDVAGMKNPMLVREVEVDPADRKNMGVLVRRYNEAFTQSMDPRVDQVARARLVNKGMLDVLGHAMSEQTRTGEDRYPTLAAYLGSPSAKHFVTAMEEAGIIDRRNRAALVNKAGQLNEDGKVFVERVLVGKVLPDADLLGEIKPSQLSAVAQSVPHIIRAQAAGHDIAPHVADALRTSVYMDRAGHASLREFDQDQTLDFYQKPNLSEEARATLEIMRSNPGTSQMAGAFRRIAQDAQRNPPAQTQLSGVKPRTTGDILKEARDGGRLGRGEAKQGGLFASLLSGFRSSRRGLG